MWPYNMSFIFHSDSMSASPDLGFFIKMFIVFHLVSIMKYVDLKSSCIAFTVFPMLLEVHL